MSRKISSKMALLVGVLLSTLPILEAGPIIAGGELNVEGTVSYSDTNKIAPRAYSPSDTYLTFTPTLRYTKESTTSTFNAFLSAPIRRYDENAFLDSDSLIFDIGSELPFGSGQKLTGSWNVSYFDGVKENYDSNRNLDTESLNINVNADLLLRNQLTLRARANYRDRSNKGIVDSLDIESGYSNDNTSDSYSIGLHARELIRGRMGAYAEYRIQNRKTQNGSIDEDDDGLNFGITGQILPERLFPKLEADLSFGFASVKRNGTSNSRMTLNGVLAYPANSKTNVSLNYRKNFDITDDDQSIERGTLSLAVDYTPQPKLTLALETGIENKDYFNDTSGRKDDMWTFETRASYSIRTNWLTTLSFNYRDNASQEILRDYSYGTVTLSTTVLF